MIQIAWKAEVKMVMKSWYVTIPEETEVNSAKRHNIFGPEIIKKTWVEKKKIIIIWKVKRWRKKYFNWKNILWSNNAEKKMLVIWAFVFAWFVHLSLKYIVAE